MIRGFFRKIGAHLRAELSFNTIVSVASMMTSLVALLIVLSDRPQQQNIAAWQLLQNYLQNAKRPQFDDGQSFALHTLAKNGVPLTSLDGHNITLSGTDLHMAHLHAASFEKSSLSDINFAGADLTHVNFSDAFIENCNCRGADFRSANLIGAHLQGGDYTDAIFDGANVSDIIIGYVMPGVSLFEPPGWAPKIGPDALRRACFTPEHPPKVSHLLTLTSPENMPLCGLYQTLGWLPPIPTK
jgi:hypothetical protein